MKISYYVKIDREKETGELLYVVESGSDLDKKYSLNDLNSVDLLNVVKVPYKKGYLNYNGKLKELLEVKEVLRDLVSKGFKSNGEKVYLVGYGVSLDNLLNKFQRNPEPIIKNDLRVVKGYIKNICGNFTDVVYVKSDSNYENNIAKLVLNKLNTKTYTDMLNLWINSFNYERVNLDLTKFNKVVKDADNVKEEVKKEQTETVVFVENIVVDELKEQNDDVEYFISYMYFNKDFKFKFINEEKCYLNTLNRIKKEVKYVEYKDKYFDFNKFYNMFKYEEGFIEYKNKNVIKYS